MRAPYAPSNGPSSRGVSTVQNKHDIKKNVNKSAQPNAATYAEFMSAITTNNSKAKNKSKNWADDDSEDEN